MVTCDSSMNMRAFAAGSRSASAEARLLFFRTGAANNFRSLAEAELVEHFEVEARALLDPLGLEELSRFLKVVDSLGELDLIASIARSVVERGVT